MKHDAKYTPAAISRRALALATVTFALLLSANGCSWMFWHHAAGGPAAPVSRSAPKEKSGQKSGRAPAVAKHAQPESAPPDAHAQMAAHPQDPYWPYVIATECLARDSVAAAEAALRSALDRDAGYAPALSSLSKLLYQSGRHEEAITLLTQALAVADRYDDETRQILLAELALHQDALGRPDLARASVAEMPKPSLKQSRSALVYVTLRGEAPDSASAMAEKALDGDSRSPVNLNNFGITRLRAGWRPEGVQRRDRARSESARPLLQPRDSRGVLPLRRRRRLALVPQLLEALAQRPGQPARPVPCRRQRARGAAGELTP
jgi:tetratricopeptide (TPR) repeat protein